MHFATGHDENILIDPLDEELPPSLPTNTRWQEEPVNELNEAHVSFTSRLPRVNFDLESGVSVVPESVTHTDTEGSDGGNGAGSDSSASVNRRTQNSSRRRTQSSLKKKQGEAIVENVASPAPVQQTQVPIEPPLPREAIPQPQLFSQVFLVLNCPFLYP